ncbi:hypothetical protein [Sphingobium yanoikuyae]|uniref:hypothetical protein n=1 Tax=Sphingobium yanoikuyae TaxID=13690 RepID=UPI0022DDCE03|nr:hypothetical protein [Sphingobium yanoikuyae]WBQ19083.1 hypothetical protein PAE53_24960 [Sphingobium yanoikuyae]
MEYPAVTGVLAEVQPEPANRLTVLIAVKIGVIAPGHEANDINMGPAPRRDPRPTSRR